MPRATDALVAAQLASGAGLLWPGRPQWPLPGAVAGTCLAAVLGGAGLAAAGLRAQGRDLTPFVDPRPEAVLHTTGPYALTRNPVYLGLLVAGAGWAGLRRRRESLAAAAALAAVLHVKTGVEERRLHERFGDGYRDYVTRTPRLIGWPGRRRG